MSDSRFQNIGDAQLEVLLDKYRRVLLDVEKKLSLADTKLKIAIETLECIASIDNEGIAQNEAHLALINIKQAQQAGGEK